MASLAPDSKREADFEYHKRRIPDAYSIEERKLEYAFRVFIHIGENVVVLNGRFV
jgi:hypothetical protein